MTRARILLPIIAVAVLLGFWHIGYLGGALFDILPGKPAERFSNAHVVSLYLSGDMGFHAGLGPKIAQRLTEEGMPVVGENSLNFFRVRRTPEETGAMIARGLRQALAFDSRARLILIGQSFGADVVAPSLPYVPIDLRRRITLIALIVPGATRQWRASPSEIFSYTEPEEDATVAARRLSWAPLLCIYGHDEKASLCPALRQPNAVRVMLPGAHSLDHDPGAVSTVLSGVIAKALDGKGAGR